MKLYLGKIRIEMLLTKKQEIEILSTKAVSKFLTAIKAMLLTKKQEQELFRKIA